MPEIGYKVVRRVLEDNSVRLMSSSESSLAITYPVGEWVSARLQHTPLFVFETLADAYAFSKCSKQFWIRICEYVPFIAKRPVLGVMPVGYLRYEDKDDPEHFTFVQDFWQHAVLGMVHVPRSYHPWMDGHLVEVPKGTVLAQQVKLLSQEG